MYPKYLEIEITGACPYACKHCYGSFPTAGELPLAKMHKIISQAKGIFDCLIFSGGEPFLHPYLPAMVQKYSEDFVAFITTSGYGITAAQVASIKHKAVLVFGLDGIGKTHDHYRGVPGAFEILMRSLAMTRELPKEIIVTLWTGVIPQIDSIFVWLKNITPSCILMLLSMWGEPEGIAILYLMHLRFSTFMKSCTRLKLTTTPQRGGL